MYSNLDERLIKLGDMIVYKKDNKNQSIYKQDNSNFKYRGIKHALCGNDTFNPKRIVVIEMK